MDDVVVCNLADGISSRLQMQPLQCTSMDNGVACKSVHEDTGECTTGAAFATCAGFLAFALMEMVCWLESLISRNAETQESQN